MAKFFSCSEKTFYDDFISSELPLDAVELTLEEFAAFLAGRESGKQIDFSSGRPVLVDPAGPTLEQLQEAAYSQRDYLLGIAALRIDPLQDAIDGDIATDEEVSRLKSWKSYRVMLNRIQTQSGFPGHVEWPAQPD